MLRILVLVSLVLCTVSCQPDKRKLYQERFLEDLEVRINELPGYKYDKEELVDFCWLCKDIQYELGSLLDSKDLDDDIKEKAKFLQDTLLYIQEDRFPQFRKNFKYAPDDYNGPYRITLDGYSYEELHLDFPIEEMFNERIDEEYLSIIEQYRFSSILITIEGNNFYRETRYIDDRDPIY